jgi:nicotinate-nucleotide pyrophosphorylase (carboxylating)
MAPDDHEKRYEEALRLAVERALAEDRVDEDVTTLAAIPEESRGAAKILFRREGILAGVDAVDAVFRAVDPALRVEWRAAEGDRIAAGAVVARLSGATRSILRAERSALNFLMHLSGVATSVARFVEAAGDSGVEILDTRKTTPGLRLLQKRAVLAGGGVNHRRDLAEMALLKENHIAAAGGVAAAVRIVRERFPGVPVEVEVENLDELEEAIASGAERVMLDNFTDDAIRTAVERIRRAEKPPYIEVSGGYDLARVGAAASLGMDGISIGAVTHSAPAMDVSLLLEERAP